MYKRQEEFELLDEILKARTEAGLTQAELATRIGTTQSSVARLESSMGKHSPSIDTLRRYASALGYRLQVRLVKRQRISARAHKVVDANAAPDKARALRRKQQSIHVTDDVIESIKRK